MGFRKYKRWMYRVGTAFLVLLVGLEVSLQAGHLLAYSLREPHELPHENAPAILCVGDSHTYGVALPSEESYPGQLQRMLDEKGHHVNVINDGVPGQNTSELRRRLPDLLDEHSPEVVVILSGFNNRWNRSEVLWSDIEDGVAESGARGAAKSLWYRLATTLRTVRLATYLWNEYRRRDDNSPIQKSWYEDREGRRHYHEWRPSDDDPDINSVMARTRRDLAAMVDMIRKAGAEPVFLTYAGKPGSPMTLANHLIVTSARSRAVPVVDIDAVIRPLITGPDGGLDKDAHDKLFLPGEHETHLGAEGYRIVAREILEELEETGMISD